MRCFHKYYLFLTVGVEAKYYAFWKGEMATLADKKLDLMDDTNSQYIRQFHWENGNLVRECSMGMTTVDWSLGGATANIGSSTSFELRDRLLQTSVTLPCDLSVPDDFAVDNGATLNLNGHTLTVTGDFVVTDGGLSIGNGTLNVTGNLLVRKGYLTIAGGTLDVGGDLRIQSATNAGGGIEYGETDAYMRMTGNSTLNIGGDFVTQSTRATLERLSLPNYRYAYDYNYYPDGRINLKGNFSQLSGAENNFVCGARVVLCGEGAQSVYFDNPSSSYFSELWFANSDENIKFASAVHGWRVGEDTVIHQGIEMVGDFAILDKFALTVKGDLTQDSGANLIGQGTLTVDGDFLVKAGYLTIEGGTLNVGGDLRIQSATNADGGIEYGETDAYMRMVSNSTLNIGGDFVTQSTRATLERLSLPNYRYAYDYNYYPDGRINLKGNFSQLAGAESNFVCGARVVLCGEGKQTVTFSSYPSSKFATLQLTKPLSNYEFNPNPCWDTLIEAETGSDETTIETPTYVKLENHNGYAVSAKIYCAGEFSGEAAYCAFYNSSGKMLGVGIQALVTGENNLTFSVNNDAVTVKLMVLNSQLIPQCDYEALEIA